MNIIKRRIINAGIGFAVGLVISGATIAIAKADPIWDVIITESYDAGYQDGFNEALNRYRKDNHHILWKAVSLTESSGKTSLSGGKVPIRYEPHIFKRCLKIKRIKRKAPSLLSKKVKKHNNDYRFLRLAKKTGFSECAHWSTSYGEYQIMGFHHSLMGFKTAKAMADAYHLNPTPEYNLMMLKRFLKRYRNGKAYKALVQYRFNDFAKIYNGSYRYARKLRANYKYLKTI